MNLKYSWNETLAFKGSIRSSAGNLEKPWKNKAARNVLWCLQLQAERRTCLKRRPSFVIFIHSSKSFPDKQLVPIQLQDESKSQPNLTGWWSSWIVQQFSSKERRQREQFPWSHQPSATPTSHFAPVKAFKQHRCTQRVSGFVWQNQTSLVTELSMQMLPKISHIVSEITVKTCSTPFVSSWNTRRRRRRKVPPVKKTNPKPTQHRHSRCFYCWCDTICEMVGNCSQTHTTGMPYGEFVTSERDWKEGTS